MEARQARRLLAFGAWMEHFAHWRKPIQRERDWLRTWGLLDEPDADLNAEYHAAMASYRRLFVREKGDGDGSIPA
ncbi:MAG: hypothetical protein AMXMBFR33_01430 [Candidatus Xenobia bacterium]